MVFEVKLIKEVRDHELLYNMSHKDYKNVNKKNAMWLKIAKKLEQSDGVCKTRWKSLRDGYRKIKNKMSLLSASNSSNYLLTKWKYFDLLSFLDEDECQKSVLKSSFNGSKESKHSKINTIKMDDSMAYDLLGETVCDDSSNTSQSKNVTIVDISNFLERAVEAIEKISTSKHHSSPLEKHFMSLGQRIERANISEREKLIIEQEVSQYVLDRLLDLEQQRLKETTVKYK